MTKRTIPTCDCWEYKWDFMGADCDYPEDWYFDKNDNPWNEGESVCPYCRAKAKEVEP